MFFFGFVMTCDDVKKVEMNTKAIWEPWAYHGHTIVILGVFKGFGSVSQI
jgi:hypothetical protein